MNRYQNEINSISAHARALARERAQQEAQGALAYGDRKVARRHLREVINLKEKKL